MIFVLKLLMKLYFANIRIIRTDIYSLRVKECNR